ncbi:hypothetical protein E5093_14410 [Acinetobacter indicus]|nr:hypothetical protein E5093_14410 [Acinetobacter indicus]
MVTQLMALVLLFFKSISYPRFRLSSRTKIFRETMIINCSWNMKNHKKSPIGDGWAFKSTYDTEI